MQNVCFLGGSFLKTKIADILNFQWIKYLDKRFIIFEKLRYRGFLLLKLQTVKVATSFH